MKLTKENLIKLIKEVISENKKSTMLLTEETRTPKYDRIIAALEGEERDIKTVVIMSGQNPMAKGPEVTGVNPQTFAASNTRLAQQLEAELSDKGISFDRIGGIFGGLPEKSLVIYNVNQWQGYQLCAKYNQWGFVFGEKYPKNAQEDFIVFKMIKLDYQKNPETNKKEAVGWMVDPSSKETGVVLKHSQLKGVDDNVSIEPTSGKKFGLELYKEGDK